MFSNGLFLNRFSAYDLQTLCLAASLPPGLLEGSLCKARGSLFQWYYILTAGRIHTGVDNVIPLSGFSGDRDALLRRLRASDPNAHDSTHAVSQHRIFIPDPNSSPYEYLHPSSQYSSTLSTPFGVTNSRQRL